MNPQTSLLTVDTNAEVAALISTLHETGQRLEELTAGEVDTVADREGRTFLLRHAQDHLRHREATKQAAILNALPAYIALLDAQGLIVSVNEAWRRFGAPTFVQGPGYAIGLNYFKICASVPAQAFPEAHRIAEGIRSVLDGAAGTFSIEYDCHLPTEKRWFLLTVTPLADDRNNGVVVMHVDVTAEWQAEEKLRTSESRFRQMADNIGNMFFLVEVDSARMLYISPAYERIWGRSCESLYTNPETWAEAIHPDDRASAYENYRNGMAGGRSKFEFRIVRPDGGSIRWIETSYFPVHDDTGKIVRIAGVARDITEHKQTAQQLQESERRFSDMLENVELVSVMLDREARITYCNEYLLHLTGWLHKEVIGRNWFVFFIPPEANDSRDVFSKLLADLPEARHHENEILTREGERRLLRWNNSVLRSSTGDVIGTASIGEDVTQRKMAEAAIAQRATELERFHRLSVGRELQMIELKKQINEMAKQAGQQPPHDLAFLVLNPVKTNTGHAPIS